MKHRFLTRYYHRRIAAVLINSMKTIIFRFATLFNKKTREVRAFRASSFGNEARSIYYRSTKKEADMIPDYTISTVKTPSFKTDYLRLGKCDGIFVFLPGLSVKTYFSHLH